MHIFRTNIDLNKNQAKNFRLQNEIAFPTVTVSDTGFTFFHSGFGNFYGWDGTSWLNLNEAGSGGGANAFLDLTDTPSAYTGLSFQFLRVNAGETGVEFAPVAIKAEDQGNGIGYAWANRDESFFYNLGLNAFDLTFAASGTNDKGVASTGGFSFGFENQLPTAGNSYGGHVAFGFGNYVTGYYGNIAMGGDNTINSGYISMQVGYQNTGNWNNSVGMGYQFGTNNTSSAYVNVSVGAGLTNNWVGSVMVGAANVIDTAAATAANRPAFTVGIGTISTAAGSVGVPTFRKDGFMVRYNSEITAPNTTIAIINAETTGKQLVTREWVIAQGYSTSATPTLQQVTTEGNSTTDNIVTTGLVSGDYFSVTDTGSRTSYGYNSGRGANFSTHIGYNAGSVSTAFSNTSVGSYALNANIVGTSNTAIGTNALRNSTNYFNTAVGANAATELVGGRDNVVVGEMAMHNATDADHNTIIGCYAASALTTAVSDENTLIGYSAGRYHGSGVSTLLTINNSIFVGYSTRANTSTSTNETVIGHNLVGNGSNTTTIGNSSITDTYLAGNVHCDSVETTGYTVATLPTGVVGKRTYVTDSTVVASGNFGATVAGTGSNIVPVFYDGTNWIIA